VLSDKFKVVLDIAHIRDPQCIKGSDGYYYIVGTPFLHGSIPYARGINDGIELFRSKTRSGPFESMGYVWKFDTASWLNTRYFTVDQERNIWAPQIHEFDGKWYIIFFATKFPKNGLEGYSIFQIGIAVADNPLGPYKETTDKPLISAPDPHLFRDDDGSTYLTYGHGHIVKLKPALDGLADVPRLIYPGNAPYPCNEGSTLFKANGKYYFGGAFSTYSFDEKGKMLGQTYDCVLTEADHIYGPYGDRYIGLKNAGNNSFFKDSDGKWYATIWQPGKITSLVEMELGPDKKWRPASNYTVVSPEVRY
jgi:beta-xylosidase